MHAPIGKSETQHLQQRLRERATEVHTLQTTIKSLQLRNTQLLRAANGPVPTAHIAVVHGAASLEPTIRIAGLLEEQGRVPVVRWARDAERVIIGIELATLEAEARLVAAS